MVTITTKWRVTVVVGEESMVFWVSDNHLGNVMRHLSTMTFAPWPVQPRQIMIGLDADPPEGPTLQT